MSAMADSLEVSTKDRIEELGAKSSQLLLFLSFAIVAAATLYVGAGATPRPFLRSAMQWWAFSIFPVLLAVSPVKEFGILFGLTTSRWHECVRWSRITLLLIAVGLSIIGAVEFLCAVYHLPMH
jgi:hypothetical protein